MLHINPNKHYNILVQEECGERAGMGCMCICLSVCVLGKNTNKMIIFSIELSLRGTE
jgi:hypothetical protein